MGIKIRTTPGFTDLYVLFQGTSIAAPATEGSDLDAGWYEADDSALATAELPIGVYSGAFLHGDYNSPDAGDTEEGVFTDFAWNGSATVAPTKVIPVNQVPVPPSRMWILKATSDGLVGEVPLVRFVGETQTFACDWRNDLASNGRIKQIESVEVIDGTPGGVTVSTDPNDLGVDHSQSKFALTLTTADTYTIAIAVTYDDSDGGGTSNAVVTLVVKDVA